MSALTPKSGIDAQQTYRYTTGNIHCHLWLREKKELEDVSAASLALHAQSFAST